MSSSTTSVVYAGNSIVCVTRSTIPGPWVLDSGVTDHLFGNPSLFSYLSTSSGLPTVILANGSKASTTSIGQARPLSSLPLNSVLYVPESIFNLAYVSKLTRTLHFSITFFADSVVV